MNRKHKIYFLISSSAWVLIGLITYIRLDEIEDQFIIYANLIIAGLHLILLILILLKKEKK